MLKTEKIMPCTNSVQLYQRYARRAKEVCASLPEGASIFKADLFNEAIPTLDRTRTGVEPIIGTLPKVKHLTAVEINPRYVKEARVVLKDHLNNGLQLIEGDMQEVSFPAGSFDAVLDLSTIDHIPKWREQIERYAEWLKPGGVLLIMAWLTWGKSFDIEQRSPEVQYYFNVDEFSRLLWDHFDVLSREAIFGDRTGPLLVEFECRKPGRR